MDCNSIIYDAFRDFTENDTDESLLEKDVWMQIIDRVIRKIEDYIREINPSKTIYIAFDGVAPHAKMMQQRQRRYKAAAALPTQAAASPPPPFNTIMITPGTDFMGLLSMRINRHFIDRIYKNGYCQVIVSTSESCGEGEHKIFDYIRSIGVSNDSACVYGLDADLIMLALNHKQFFNRLFVFREVAEFQNLTPIAKKQFSLPDSLPEKYNFVDIHELSRCIEIHSGACSQDYIFLCFFLGNDFMPHFPALNIRTHGIDLLLDTYKKHFGKSKDSVFIKQGKIQWKKLATILREIGSKEQSLLIDEDKTRAGLERKYKSMIKTLSAEERALNVPVIFRELEKYIYPYEEGWEYRYYRVLFDFDVTEHPEKVREICINYLEGLQWTYNYYSNKCIDWSWSYKYHYPPLIHDLIKYIPYFETDYFEDREIGKPVSAKEQLKLVMPPKYKHLYDDGEGSTTAESKQSQPHMVWAYCRYDWEGHMELDDDLSAQPV